MDPGVLEKGERELIASYLEILQSFGAPAPSPDAAFEQFRIHALFVFIAVVVTAASGRMQGPEVVEPAIRDVCAALERLDAVAALGGLDR